MIDNEWRDIVRSMVVEEMKFLSTDAGWRFTGGGVASEMILDYTSTNLTVSITVSPMELPFLTIRQNEDHGGRLRFSATGDRLASKYSKEVYREVESKKLRHVPESLASTIKRYIEIQAEAVRKYISADSKRARQSAAWKRA